MQELKSAKAKRLFLEGDTQASLAIYKGFRMGFSREEKRVIEVAHEVLAGHSAFYRSLGIDTKKIVIRANEVIERYIQTK